MTLVDWLRRLGWLLPCLGSSHCVRCGCPWWAATWREVWWSECRGQFALCTWCWARTSSEERVRAHARVTARYGPVGDDAWLAIAAAVRRDSAV
jgi:hypothetical protein